MPKRKKSSNKHAFQAQPANYLSAALPLNMLVGAALIVVAVYMAYLPSQSGGFVLDDNKLLTENELIKAPDGLCRFWCSTESQDYWPMTNTTLWIEWRLWEMNSTGYHIVNLILHIAEALLIWVILRKLSIPGAFFAALIFAVHPVNVESVAWIAQRKNLMAMLFFLLSILWYLNSEMRYTPSQNLRYPAAANSWRWLSLGAFVLAMLSKGSVAVLPILLLGIIWWLRPLKRWDLVRIAPFFAVATVLAGVNVWFQTHGTAIFIRSASFVERLLGACGVIWFYLYKAFLPVDLAFIYTPWHIEAGNPLWWLPLLATLVVTMVLWRHRKGWSRPWLFAWVFFCLALAPVMGFTDVGFMAYSLVADHYQHIAIIGVIALVGAGFSLWQQRLRETAHRTATVLAIAAVGALVLLTWQQSAIYRDAVTLYRATLKKNPDCWIIHKNLAVALDNAGRKQEAIECYGKALRMKPDDPKTHTNLGDALFQTGRTREAIQHYEKALQLNPDYILAYNNLASALVKIGSTREAIDYFEQALRIKADYPEAHNNLGAALVSIGRPLEAIRHYEQALQINPKYAEAHFNLGNVSFNSGRLQEAIEHYTKALLLNPDFLDAHNNLGYALIQTGHPQEAIEHIKRALQLKPDYSNAYANLAEAYASMHQSTEAIAAVQKAIQLAQSQGRIAQAKQLENWLNSYRARLSGPPQAPPPSQSVSP